MAEFYTALDERLIRFIGKQKIFFTAGSAMAERFSSLMISAARGGELEKTGMAAEKNIVTRNDSGEN